MMKGVVMLTNEKITWVLLADGAEARIYKEKKSRELSLLDEFSSKASHSLTHELVSDRPGRSYESMGTGARRSMEAQSDPQAVAKEKFVAMVAAHLNDAALAKKYDHLIVCAPPHVLGELRQCLDGHTKKLVQAELHKDLMKTPIAELHQHIAKAEKPVWK
jgi:protein required for attachment to host cells